MAQFLQVKNIPSFALLWFYFCGMLLTPTCFMAANNKKMQFFYVSNTWDHRLPERLKLNITFLLSENSEYILSATASRTSNSQNCWVKLKKPKYLEQALKSRARPLNWGYIPLTPLQRESLQGNVKGTKQQSRGKYSPTLPPRKAVFQSLKTESRSFTDEENAPRPGAIVQKQTLQPCF